MWVIPESRCLLLRTRQTNSMSPKDHIKALPDYFQVLLEHAQDISNNVVVPWPETLSGTLVTRVHSWKQVKSINMPSAAARKRQKDCPLCGLAESDPKTHGSLWETYAGDEKQFDKVVRSAQDAGLPGVTPPLVKLHFQNHNYEQPAPTGRIPVEDRIKLINTIPDRKGRVPIVLQALYRHRFLSRRQIVQLLIPGSNSSQADNKTVSRLLNKMRFKHAVYEFRLEGQGTQKFYALGAYGTAYVEQLEGDLVGKVGVTRLEQISPMKLKHDIKASDVFILMRCQLHDVGAKIESGGRSLAVEMPPESWWAERNLSMAFPVPGGERKIEPDGFATLAVNDGRHVQAHLPMWLEWDSGHKQDRTIEQIINYVAFAQSGAASRRFPQTNVEGYKIPLLMVTNTPERAVDLAERVRKEAAAQHIDLAQAGGMWITDQQTMETGVWQPGAWRSISTGETAQVGLADILLEASKPLLDKSPIHSRFPVEIDIKGARPISTLQV